ncbi:MAG: hypothetical protein ABIT64_00430 [Lysobacteraceae bacterium]
MRFRHLLASFLVCLSFAVPLAMAQQFSSLEERMSSSDFKAAGLDKLTPDELARLNDFVKKEVDNRTAQARAAAGRNSDKDPNNFGFHTDRGERDSLVTRIAGKFTGWTGNTVFTLNNGQVWQQVDSSAQFEGINLQNPEVTISPSFMGSWMLGVKGYNSQVRVKRIK